MKKNMKKENIKVIKKIKEKNINPTFIKNSIDVVAKAILIVFVSVILSLIYTGIRAIVNADKNKAQTTTVLTPVIESSDQTSILTPIPTPTATVIYQIPSKYKYLFKAVNKKEDIPKIHLEEAKVLFESGKALFIDTRGKFEYNQSHIPGAVEISVGEAASKIPQMADILKDKVLVPYCHGAGCHLSDKVAYALYDAGYRKIAIYFGGWPEWTNAKMPIEEYQSPEQFKHLFLEADNENKIVEITLDEAKFLYDNMLANFLDVDYTDKFNKIHIDRAINFPIDKVDQYLPGYDNFLRQKPVVIYCHGSGGKSRTVAKKLYKAGYKKILLFIQALKKWESAGYPVYKNPNAR